MATSGKPSLAQATCAWLARIVLRRRIVILVVFVALTLIASFGATKLRFEQSLDSWFVQKSEELATYNQFRERFGNDRFVVLGLYPSDVFSQDFLTQLQSLSEILQQLPHVERVVSLTNVKELRRNGDRVHAAPFLSSLHDGRQQTADELERLRDRVSQSSLSVRRLLDSNQTATAVLVELSQDAANVDIESQVVRQIRHCCEQEFDDTVVYRLAGTPVLNDAIFSYSRRDLLVLGPLAIIACAITCWLLLRSWTAALLGTLAPLVAALWVLGLMGYAALPISFLTSALLLVVLVAGITDSVHLLTTYYANFRAGQSRATSLRSALTVLVGPCSLTTMTTVAGFLSLVICDIQPVRQFGLLAAFGLSSALIVSLYLIPAMLLTGPVRSRYSIHRLHAQRISYWLDRAGTLSRRQRGIALAIGVMIVGPCLVAIPTLKTANSPLSLFHPHQTVYQDTQQIESSFGGFATLEFQFTSSHSVLHWDQLREIGQFARWLEDSAGVNDTLSFVDVLEETHRIKPYERDRLGRPRGLWQTLREAERVEPKLVRRMIQQQDTIARVSARVALTSSLADASRIEAIDRHLTKTFSNSELEVCSTGYVKLFSQLRGSLVQSQIESLGLAALAITVVMALALRSWTLGLLSILFNFLPICCGLGVMAACGIAIDPGTVMIATVALGIVVDDTCHLLWNMRKHAEKGMSIKDALRTSARTTGPAILVTSLILVVGFSTLTLGSFAPSVYFGFVMVLVVLTALLVDLILVPIAISALSTIRIVQRSVIPSTRLPDLAPSSHSEQLSIDGLRPN